MKKMLTCLAGTLAVAAICAAPVGKSVSHAKIHVPTTLQDVKPIDPAAAKANHVLLVNVANAVSAADWERIAPFAISRLQINLWTNSAASSPLPAILKDPKSFKRLFGEKAKVGVFLVDSDESFPIIAAPGAWARVNIRFLKADSPDPVTYADRVARMILKGIVAASGGGASLDIDSANHVDTFDVAGLDKRNIIITPDVYFPMLDTLRVVGGNEIISPAFTEPEE